jgi:hypothetical protein
MQRPLRAQNVSEASRHQIGALLGAACPRSLARTVCLLHHLVDVGPALFDGLHIQTSLSHGDEVSPTSNACRAASSAAVASRRFTNCVRCALPCLWESIVSTVSVGYAVHGGRWPGCVAGFRWLLRALRRAVEWLTSGHRDDCFRCARCQLERHRRARPGRLVSSPVRSVDLESSVPDVASRRSRPVRSCHRVYVE